MKKILPVLAFLLSIVTARAQLISKFTWETSNVLQSAYGPNAISISSYAVSSAGGAKGTNGLNPGTGSHDINMVLPGSSFTIPGLDIAVDFLRKESQASFFTLGNFDFGINGGYLYAKFALIKGSSDTIVNATSLYNVPSDNAYHTYRFVYNSSTGLAMVYADGISVYSFQTAVSTGLYWTGAGNATVGTLMDGTGSNIAVLDNLIVSNPAGSSILPLELLAFDARPSAAYNALSWTTTREMNTRDFTIERSLDGVRFEAIGTVAAAGNYSGDNQYSFTDKQPEAGVSYYRLKMTDIDGAYTWSDVKKIGSSAAVTINCYPNPVIDQVNIRINDATASGYLYSLVTLDGKMIYSGKIAAGNSLQQVSLNVSGVAKGILLIRVQNEADQSSQTFKVVKQ